MRRRSLVLTGLGLVAASSAARAAPSDLPTVTMRRTGAPRVVLELPWSAADPVRLTEPRSGVGVAVRPLEAAAVHGERLSGATSFPHAFGDAHLLLTYDDLGFEDTTYFPTRPARERARYEIELENVAGLRLFDDVLELLDAAGAPRLRMNRPWIRDRFGEIHMLDVTLSGCAFDNSPLPPWRRPTTSPGSERCEVALDWTALEIAYPAELDPAWTVTGQLLAPRTAGSMCGSGNGTAVMAAGYIDLVGFTSSAEMFDLATETWSVIAPTTHRRLWAPCATLLDDRVLISGGYDELGDTSASFELYDPSSGQWTDGLMTEPREMHTLTALADGRVLAAGGYSLAKGPLITTELFTPGPDVWVGALPLSDRRHFHSAARLADGRVLVAGGRGDIELVSGCDLFDPVTSSWTPAAPMPTPREHFPLSAAGGQLLAVGGTGVLGTEITTVESYDPALDAWSPRASLPLAMDQHHVLALPSGRALLFAGNHEFGLIPIAYAYDPDLDAWLVAGPGVARSEALATTLSDGSLLAASGYDLGKSIPLPTFRFVESLIGEDCSEHGACESSVCRDGVCCEEPCDQSCERCNQDGECVAVVSADDPDSCTGDSTCDPTGQCKQANGVACGSGGECASGHCVDGVCCDRACAGSCEACDGADAGTCDFVVGAPHGDRPPCANGEVCNGSEVGCVALGLCQDARFAVQSDGSLRDCAPYVCSSDGACLSTCSSVYDCAGPYVCDASGDCVEPTFEQPSPSCRAAAARAEKSAWAVVALLGLFARAGRRLSRATRAPR